MSRIPARSLQHLTTSARNNLSKTFGGRHTATGLGALQHVRHFSFFESSGKQRLVILGSGWGGYQVLRKVDKKRYDVTVVSPRPHFVFTPLLAGCAVGTLEFRSTLEPVSRYGTNSTSYLAWCDSIDFKRKRILCTPATPHPSFRENALETSEKQTFWVDYDHLVIAVGAYAQTFGIPGVKEHAHFLKTIADARNIRQRIIECFEQASQPTLTDTDRRKLLHFCVVGGGPTGVEFAAELHDLLHSDAVKHYPSLAGMARITLYDVAPHILSSFDESLSRYTENKFARSGITIKSQHHVEKVTKGIMTVKEEGDVPFGLLVWSTGLSPNPLIQSVEGIQKDNRTGSLVTDEYLNIKRSDGGIDKSVWAIGDAATVEGTPLPATAQVANQKGLYLAKLLNTMAKEKEVTTPFQFHNMGSLAYIGDKKAVFDRSNEAWNTQETGFMAWLLWRSAYMTMTLSWRNKLVVPFYWALNMIFGRDMSRF